MLRGIVSTDPVPAADDPAGGGGAVSYSSLPTAEGHLGIVI